MRWIKRRGFVRIVGLSSVGKQVMGPKLGQYDYLNGERGTDGES
jgi:hypothetical protein